MADNDLSGRPAHGAETGRPAFADWSRTFLGELAATSNVSAAARLAGISSFVVYETRRTTPEFNRKWQEAVCEGDDHLEMALLVRLRVGEIKPATGVNQGGAMVESVLRAADVRLPLRLVHASKDKVVRAEPVAALYEAGKVRHAGQFPGLEDELCGLVAGGEYHGPGRSHDRADAAVWALTELMLGRRAEPRISIDY